ncbi:MAG: hypothetical protein M3Z16_09800 [Pseudomonadota bacterium]|nr:hypothetical protein [Pseudomonadota bacterium]
MLGAAVLAAAWLATWWGSRQRIQRISEQLSRSEERQSAAMLEKTRLLSELDGLRAEVRQQKRLVESSRARNKVTEEQDRWREVKAMNDLFIEPRPLRKTPDFEDTQIL